MTREEWFELWAPYLEPNQLIDEMPFVEAPAGPYKYPQDRSFILGGFPYSCLDNHCTTKNDCLLNGCAKGRSDLPRRVSA